MPSYLNTLMNNEVQAFTEGSLALILIDSSRLKADETLKFRADLRKVGAKYKVAKSALVKRALPDGSDALIPFRGTVGLIKPAADIAAAAKLINALVKEEKVSIKGGVLEGKAMDAKSAAKLSEMPTREQANVLVIRTLAATFVRLVRIVKVKSEEGAEPVAVAAAEPAAAAPDAPAAV
jgi:large subunit ribosomal protein L10